MNKTPLFKSRRFWIAVLDAIISVASIVITSIVAPEQVDLALKLIGYIQPAIITVIIAFTVDDTVQTFRMRG